ncbi:MAG: site-2 protease family protein, partial [candidate division KSB1 bacterium]
MNWHGQHFAPPSGIVTLLTDFGNLISNISRCAFDEFVGRRSCEIHCGNFHDTNLLPSYGYARPGELVALINSFDRLELGVVQDHAQSRLAIPLGASIIIKRGSRTENMSNPTPSAWEETPHTSTATPATAWLTEALRSDQPRLHVILFVLTCVSTFFTGYASHGKWSAGLWYSAGIIGILFAHEMGHYLMCVRYRIHATLPFFIPFPLSPFGTLGAVIRMDARMPNRRALFDIGVAGPLAGLALTLPAIYFGLKMSTLMPVSGAEGTITLGDSLLFKALSDLALGPLPEGQDTLLHPLAYAGWAGLFVTALNLLPIGQLDGGHILYALLGDRGQKIYPVNMAMFALLCIIEYHGWVLLVMMLLWFGYR